MKFGSDRFAATCARMSRLLLSTACFSRLSLVRTPNKSHRQLSGSSAYIREDLPIIGGIPPSVTAQHPQFWLEFNNDKVPDRFQPGELHRNVERLPFIFSSFRKDLGLRPGSRYSRKLRSYGFIPGLLDSLPMKQPPVHLVHAKGQMESMIRTLGTNVSCQLSILHIIAPDELAKLNMHEHDVREMLSKGWQPSIHQSFQVLPRRVHFNHVPDALLGMTFMNCPSHRIVECLVPVVPVNADESPSAKRGGYPLITKRFLKVRSIAINIPQSIKVDCSTFETGHKVFLRDVALGQGQHVVANGPETCLIVMETSG